MDNSITVEDLPADCNPSKTRLVDYNVWWPDLLTYDTDIISENYFLYFLQQQIFCQMVKIKYRSIKGERQQCL